MYDHGRYFATTGRRWPNAPGEVRERTAELAILHERVFGSNGASGPESARTNGNARHDLEEIIETLRAEYGSRFERLWNGDKSDFGDDDSRADPALVSLIAQITDDPATIDAVFRRSKLYRTKWDRKDYRERTIAKALRGKSATTASNSLRVEDFYAFLPQHSYLHTPTREFWTAASIRACRFTHPVTGTLIKNPCGWLDANRAIVQVTWAPGEPPIIEDRVVNQGGWLMKPGAKVFNLYLGPVITHGDATKAGPWLELLHALYPDDSQRILWFLAHRVQRPHEKINHGLVLGGKQGIGKDTLLEPIRYAVGPWNFQEVSPVNLLGRFNPFVKSVVLRVSEARDLGDLDRYAFYEHMKVYTASPPEVLRCDEKNIREHAVFNACGVVMTTNHKTHGIYLPADDRRHYVAWSDRLSTDYSSDYWRRLHAWYEAGGFAHVAAYLKNVDLSDFDPKAPPPKTPAFWAIVDANRPPENAELADALDKLENPDAVTLATVLDKVIDPGFVDWLRDRRNGRVIPHRFEEAGYVATRNPDAKDGLWKIQGRRVAVYAKAILSLRDRTTAARALTDTALG